MNGQTESDCRILLIAAALVLTLWGVVGFVQGIGRGYTDALFAPDYTMPHVEPDGPLAEAGFLPGDSVVSVEGIPVSELGMYSRWPRSLSRRPGESLRLVVERDGQLVSGDVVYRTVPRSIVMFRLGGIVVALSFLGFGMWAYLTVRTSHSQRLVYVGLAAAAGVAGPSLGRWDGVAAHVQTAAMALWTLLVLRFFLFYPSSKRLSESRVATGAIYLPWVILLLCLVLELIYHPRLYHSFGGFFSLVMLGYLFLAVAAVLHTVLKTPREELRDSGMAIVIVGIVVAIVPTLVAAVDVVFLSSVSIPGSGYFPLLIAVIPVTLAFAVRGQGRQGDVPVR